MLHYRCNLRKGLRISRSHLTNHNRPNSTATPVGLRPWRSSKKVSLLEGETGLTPARKTLPNRYGSCKSHTFPRYVLWVRAALHPPERPSPLAMGHANRIPSRGTSGSEGNEVFISNIGAPKILRTASVIVSRAQCTTHLTTETDSHSPLTLQYTHCTDPG